jgi:hypothetical protein
VGSRQSPTASPLERLAPSCPHYALALEATTAEEYVTEVSLSWSAEPNRAKNCTAIYNAHVSGFGLQQRGAILRAGPSVFRISPSHLSIFEPLGYPHWIEAIRVVGHPHGGQSSLAYPLAQCVLARAK